MPPQASTSGSHPVQDARASPAKGRWVIWHENTCMQRVMRLSPLRRSMKATCYGAVAADRAKVATVRDPRWADEEARPRTWSIGAGKDPAVTRKQSPAQEL
jgi:hypothetical protein